MANIFSSLKYAYNLFKHIDFDKLEAISKKVDLPKMVETISNLDEKQLSGMMKMMGGSGKKRELPPIEADFYHLGDEALKDEDRQLQLKVRAFLEKEVKPIVNEYWNRAEFPFEIIPKLAELNI
ncbi:MAG: acyl-CoA dehydrogenase, partial [Sphingobacteriales bacterium]